MWLLKQLIKRRSCPAAFPAFQAKLHSELWHTGSAIE